ncbi:MAG: hypothetical protein IPK83_16295 [Planctomycetes bacterium]|nr:hypothetical protein [Planctomycetota bacterium]
MMNRHAHAIGIVKRLPHSAVAFHPTKGDGQPRCLIPADVTVFRITPASPTPRLGRDVVAPDVAPHREAE